MHLLKMLVAQLHSLRGRVKLSLMWEYFEKEEEIQRDGKKRQDKWGEQKGWSTRVLFWCAESAAKILESVEFDGTQMKRKARNWRKRCEQHEYCRHQINLNTIFHVSPKPPLIFFHPPSLSLHHPPPPFISLSLCLSKNPTTVFKDRTPVREVDGLVAKVMTTAIWSTQIHPDVAYWYT